MNEMNCVNVPTPYLMRHYPPPPPRPVCLPFLFNFQTWPPLWNKNTKQTTPYRYCVSAKHVREYGIFSDEVIQTEIVHKINCVNCLHNTVLLLTTTAGNPLARERQKINKHDNTTIVNPTYKRVPMDVLFKMNYRAERTTTVRLYSQLKCVFVENTRRILPHVLCMRGIDCTAQRKRRVVLDMTNNEDVSFRRERFKLNETLYTRKHSDIVYRRSPRIMWHTRGEWVCVQRR